MRIFILWSDNGNAKIEMEPAQVAARIQGVFAPLFAGDLPQAHILGNGSVSLVSLELPVHQWKPAFFEQQSDSWAFAPEYPINARSVLHAHSIRFSEHNVLLTLSQCLQQDPEPFLRELTPPFSLIWRDGPTGQVFFQNDGLGMAQLFEYQQGEVWALTNRIQCLKGLGLAIEPEPVEWAARLTIGWFPLNLTGYKRIQFMAPGTQGSFSANGIQKKQCDVLPDWVHPTTMSENECLELGRTAMLALVEDTVPLCREPLTVGLSGGWDSRVVVALLRALKANFSLRVRGLPERSDVIIAHHLAKLAGMDIRVKTQGGLPPDDAQGCRKCISQALLWQSGYMDTKQHKSFLVKEKYLSAGKINIMGQHAGLGKADFARKIHADTLQPSQYEAHIMEEMMKGMPSFTRTQLHDSVYDLILKAYNQADAYGLTGLRKLDFFFLFEYTRRWASGSLNSSMALVFAPFLNPNFVRACYAYPVEKLPTKPFHRHITAYYAPDWKNVPYEDQKTRKELKAMGIEPPKVPDHKVTTPLSTWKRAKGNRNFKSSAYWQEVGAPIIFNAIEQGGFWTTIFDPDLVKLQWESAPDAFAIAYLLPETLE